MSTWITMTESMNAVMGTKWNIGMAVTTENADISATAIVIKITASQANLIVEGVKKVAGKNIGL